MQDDGQACPRPEAQAGEDVGCKADVRGKITVDDGEYGLIECISTPIFTAVLCRYLPEISQA